MQNPEKELIRILKKTGVDFTSSLPCEKIKCLLEMIETEFFHVRLTREEEGVGISAGAAISGKRVAMFVQSSGIGNMINALLSLTDFYKLPLAIFVSQRGLYKEKIEAQVPMGKRLPFILEGAGIAYTTIKRSDDFGIIERKLRAIYSKNKIHVFLMSPAIWEASVAQEHCVQRTVHSASQKKVASTGFLPKPISSKFSRYQILRAVAPYLEGKVVVCNLGFPSKELYSIKHRTSNFYMLGSMGMATPIGLGISLSTDKEVVVIDGDGSLLMNLGVLATAAYYFPQNLTIIAIDNGAYGSTGSQPTLTASCVDLCVTAYGLGIRNIMRASSEKEVAASFKRRRKGLKFLYVAAVSGNRDVPNIPLHHLEIKQQVQKFLGVV